MEARRDTRPAAQSSVCGTLTDLPALMDCLIVLSGIRGTYGVRVLSGYGSGSRFHIFVGSYLPQLLQDHRRDSAPNYYSGPWRRERLQLGRNVRHMPFQLTCSLSDFAALHALQRLSLSFGRVSFTLDEYCKRKSLFNLDF